MTTDNRPIRWLHLSDFHVGKDDYASRKMFDYIIEHVRKRKAAGVVPDFLFLTGDLANKGLESEYETFWLEFIEPLHAEIGAGVRERTFAVPGNHDVTRTENPAFSREEIASANSRYLDPTSEGRRLRNMLAPRFKAYEDSDCTVTSGAFSGNDGAFSQSIEIHGVRVGIVGINTAWLSKEHDLHQLTPGKPLLEKALAAIADTDLRIVLGHHPVDWFIPSQQKPINSLLGQHRVLYLHGHLHDAWAEPRYGGGSTFLAVQAGAGFQAREGEKWRNGLVWGEADLDTGELKLQPWRWIHDQQAWTLATDAFHEHHRKGEWWHYPLPGLQPTKVNYSPVIREIRPPKGWAVVQAEGLHQYCIPLEQEVALRFFDGAVPSWNVALSSSIPHRKIVNNLVSHFQNTEVAEVSNVTLLLAAGCEGKTTALLQAAYSVIKDREDWRILHRHDESQRLLAADILPLLLKEFTWLVVVDEADRIASDILGFLKLLPEELHGRVHCLLACRDSDWKASQADQLNWSSSVRFHVERLSGLEHEDAQAIVTAWQAFGDQGLGDLARFPAGKRISALENQASEEAKTATGAFFGALLAVRNGADLQSHARLQLERLGQRKLRSGGTLRDALAYIAVMHAENLEFLSRPVLAQALGCPLERLHRDVLVPLGQEAAATTTSSFIFTRHRRIAETLVLVLEREFSEDIRALYVTLAEAAIEAFKSGPYVPVLSSWRFDFPNHFFMKEEYELSLQIARAELLCEPDNSLTRTNLANLYRKVGAPDQAIQIFREIPGHVENNRAFYYEWSVAEGECGNYAVNALLAAYSLSDQCSAPRVTARDASKTLSGLGVALGALYEAYDDDIFRDARMAASIVGLAGSVDAVTKGYLQAHVRETAAQGAEQPSIDRAFELLCEGIVAAESIGVDSFVERLIPNADEMTFSGLRKLIKFSSSRS